MISENAGVEGMVVVDQVRRHKDGSYGYDAATGEYCDLFEHGIIDPAKVTRSALENAASIASLLLTTETLVADIPEPPSAGPPGPPPMDY
jgi:chaperonin GroEL